MNILRNASTFQLMRRSASASRIQQTRQLCSSESSGNSTSEMPKRQSSGYGKAIAVTLVGVTGLVGGAVAYGFYDKKFLDKLETATGLNLGFLRAGKKSAEAYLPFLAGDSAASGQLSRPAPPALPTSSSGSLAMEDAKPAGLPGLKPAAEKKQQQQPQTPAAQPAKKSSTSNAEQLARLASLKKSVSDAMEEAVAKGIAAETKARQHGQQLKQAMASKADSDWAQVKAAEAAKDEALKLAGDANQKAEKLLSQFKSVLDDPKVQSNSAAKSGLAEYKTFLFELDSIRANTDRAEAETRILSEYKVEADKQQQQMLRSEVENLLPLDKRSPVEEFEQRERHLVQQAVDKSAAAGTAMTEAAVERELKQQMLQWEEEKKRLTQQLRESWEVELQQELSRQAAAHTNHVTQLTRTLRDQLTREHQAELRAALLKEHEEFEAALQGWTARVRGVESAVEGRAEALESAQRAQQLWLAAHSLRDAVTSGRNFRAPMEAVVALASRLGQDDAASALTAALPTVAPSPATRPSACAQVALIPETGGSLWLHLVSRLQASLMLRRAAKPLKPEDPVDPQNPPSLFDWLDTAEAALNDRGDLETAVRAMARLPGMARLLADDWIRDARAHLEARQTASALCSLAAAMGLDAATQHRLPGLADSD
uniref:MICOS complex subunit MIC60 n=1 Tax=Macrostomum lignano TaxID=282301 RepID=A0A1I8IGZ2_9PLAT